MDYEITRIVIHDENTGVTIIMGARDEHSQNYPTLVLNGATVNWTFGVGDLTDNEEYYRMEGKLFQSIRGIEEVAQYIKRYEDLQPKSGVSLHAAPNKLGPSIPRWDDPGRWDELKSALDGGKRFKVNTERGGIVYKDVDAFYHHDLPSGGGSSASDWPLFIRDVIFDIEDLVEAEEDEH